MSTTGKNSHPARSISRSEVFEVVRTERTISRSRLADMVSVSRATVSSIVAEMLENGLLEEVGEGESTGGRPPVELRYRPESRLTVGIVVSGDQVKAILTDLDGNPVGEEFERAILGQDPDSMLLSMKAVAEDVLEKRPRHNVLGIGVGTPGIVDSETGVIEVSVSKRWLQGKVGVKDYLEDELGLPVHTVNRSRVAALGEARVGVGRGVSNLIYLFLGDGVAAGVVVDDELFFGTGFSAGEIGHVSVAPDGPLCDCGNRGCLEVYAKQSAILATARAFARQDANGLMQQVTEGGLEQLTFEQILQCAREGDESAIAVLEEVGSKVGMAVSTLINLFNPEMVIIGGPTGCAAQDLLLEPVIVEARRRTISRSFGMTKIVSGVLGTRAAAIGSAVHAINRTPVDDIFDTAQLDR